MSGRLRQDLVDLRNGVEYPDIYRCCREGTRGLSAQEAVERDVTLTAVAAVENATKPLLRCWPLAYVFAINARTQSVRQRDAALRRAGH